MGLPKTVPMKVAGGKEVAVPMPGFGTFTLKDPTNHAETIARAINAGYRHLDCAWEYGVSHLVGQGIKLSSVPREELFVVSKFSPQFAAPENVKIGLENELAALDTPYIDLFLAHMPHALKTEGDMTKATMAGDMSFASRGIASDENSNYVQDLEHSTRRMARLNGSSSGSFLPTWRAMKELVRSGKVRAIGVSNFEIEDLEEVLAEADDIPISANQIEVHPWFPNNGLIAFMNDHAILPVAYCPLATLRHSLANGIYKCVPCAPDDVTLLEEPTVIDVATRNGMGPAQVLHSWLTQRGIVSLGASDKDDRIRENLDVKELSAADFDALAALEKKGTRGKSIILTWNFTPILFGDVPGEEVDGRANGSAAATNGVNGH